MNPSYKPLENKSQYKYIESIELGKEIIKDAIKNNQQCFWHDIIKENDNRVNPDLLLEASRALQKEKMIRLRECSFEHAMEYILI